MSIQQKEMKFMNNDDGNNNRLGFSLISPHQMKMEANESAFSSSVPTAMPESLFHSQSHLGYGGYCGGINGENGGFYCSLPVMPLKSDGSLCIVEALTRSQTQATTVTTTPKLEDFFGGATIGTQHYETNDREAMALSLDSMHPHHHYHEDQDHDQANNQNCLNHLSRSPRHQQHQIQFQHYPYYNANYRSHEMLVGDQQSKETLVSSCSLQLPGINQDDGINGMRDWVSRNYQDNHAMDLQQKMISCMGDNNNGGEPGAIISAMTYGDFHSLSLSMSPGSQSSCVAGCQQISATVTDSAVMETKKRGSAKVDQKQIVHRKSIDTFGQRTSQYRGVTRHRWTGRYEAHLWDNSCKKEGQSRKGRQVYLGGYDMEEKAARAYDLAALKYWGPSTHINFPLESYQTELEEMKNMTRQEFVAHLRRKSSGFSRGASMYRGVTRHHQHGRWQARIGRVAGNKDLYLGTFGTQEEAAEAYDIAAIKFRGVNAVTNFNITRYDVERIMASNTLLSGESARRNKHLGSNPSIHNSIGIVDAIPLQKINEDDSDWKVATHQSSYQQLDQRESNVQQAVSLATENVIGIETTSWVHRQHVEDSTKLGSHLSNASSLVTSLSSSREASPDRGSLPMIFALPPLATSKLLSASPSSNMNYWPAVSLPHLPVYASWSDA